MFLSFVLKKGPRIQIKLYSLQDYYFQCHIWIIFKLNQNRPPISTTSVTKLTIRISNVYVRRCSIDNLSCLCGSSCVWALYHETSRPYFIWTTTPFGKQQQWQHTTHSPRSHKSIIDDATHEWVRDIVGCCICEYAGSLYVFKFNIRAIHVGRKEGLLC